MAANTAYNLHQLQYKIGGAPNSNSYAYTLLVSAGLLGLGTPRFAQPSDTPGWGYNVITNPSKYP
jgi:hypothetical protein